MSKFKETIIKYAIFFEELRIKFVRLVKIFAAVFCIGTLGFGPFIRIVVDYSAKLGITVITTSPFQMLDLAMSVGFFLACVVCIPVFIYYLYSFLKPALRPHERRFVLLSFPVGMLLFFLGFLYSSFILSYAVKIIAEMNTAWGVANYWDVGRYVSQVIMASIFFGVVFEFPIVLTFLIRVGVLKLEFLKKNRKYAVIIVFLFVGLLPPPEVVTTLFQALPLIVLYELTIRFNSYLFRKREAKIKNIQISDPTVDV